MIDLDNVLKTLRDERPVFHSEADFQHALAWLIHTQHPTYSLRLEHPLSPDQPEHLDIVAFDKHYKLAIELKYKTSPLFAPVREELFYLKNHSAQDQGRYDFLKDIQKLEQFVSGNTNAIGYAILLTNDSSYWNRPRNASTTDANFRIHGGRVIEGTLSWRNTASEGTTKNRKEDVAIRGKYVLNWKEYHEIEVGQYVRGSRKFRYLSVKVTP
jgi:hypothetical protein